jgi:hypothetical protein
MLGLPNNVFESHADSTTANGWQQKRAHIIDCHDASHVWAMCRSASGIYTCRGVLNVLIGDHVKAIMVLHDHVPVRDPGPSMVIVLVLILIMAPILIMILVLVMAPSWCWS